MLHSKYRCVPRLRLPTAVRRAAGILAAAALSISLVQNVPANQPAENFDVTTWARLQAQLPRPAIVVFSTTYCPNCPEVFESLAKSIAQRRMKAPLVAVVMDGAGQPALAGQPHYRRADRIFVFQGSEVALRHSVDPRWRGVTPYVALLSRDSPPVFIAGRPSDQAIDTWARSGAR